MLKPDSSQAGRRGWSRFRFRLAGWLLVAAAIRLLPTGASAATAHPTRPAPGEPAVLMEMARDGTNTSRLYRLGEICHSAGVDGDKEAVIRAEAYLRRLLTIESTNAPATALLGSVYTMKGRDAFWPTTQLRLVREGNEFMDQAVRLAPEDPEVRLIRGLNNAHMPDFLGRTAVVRTDLAWLWEKVEKEPVRFTVAKRQEMALHWGRQLLRQDRAGQARDVWERGKSFDPDSKLAKSLMEELAKLR